jgi:hypothetical protein
MKVGGNSITIDMSGITIKGTTFTDVNFRFPEGNE